jgi:hypothetical protein
VQITLAKEKYISLKIKVLKTKRRSFSKQKKNKNLLNYITQTIYNKLKKKLRERKRKINV